MPELIDNYEEEVTELAPTITENSSHSSSADRIIIANLVNAESNDDFQVIHNDDD